MASGNNPHTKEYCLARAAECERMAEETRYPASKAIFLDQARRWYRLAMESETSALEPVGKAALRPSPQDIALRR
jgi:hypothetical protein